MEGEFEVNVSESRVTLRGVELSDVDFMYKVENDRRNWQESGTIQPFSAYLLSRFVDSQGSDIYATRQLRLMVETKGGEVVGMVDLFEFDPQNHRAGVGIFIAESHRNRGYGAEAMQLLEGYCRSTLQLHQLWCGVAVSNLPSISMFERLGYQRCGVRQEWTWRDGGYEDEIMFQRFFCEIG